MHFFCAFVTASYEMFCFLQVEYNIAEKNRKATNVVTRSKLLGIDSPSLTKITFSPQHLDLLQNEIEPFKKNIIENISMEDLKIHIFSPISTVKLYTPNDGHLNIEVE